MHSIVIWIIRGFVAAVLLLVAIAALRGRLGHHYQLHFGREERRERLFLASLAFLVTMLALRGITWSIHNHIGPFHDVHGKSGFHLHHMVWGILLLLVLGYLWLMQIGTGMNGASQRASVLMAVLYGLASALTLDEFALWLRFQDVYWLPQGRESIEASMMFIAVLSISAFGGRFFHSMASDVLSFG